MNNRRISFEEINIENSFDMKSKISEITRIAGAVILMLCLFLTASCGVSLRTEKVAARYQVHIPGTHDGSTSKQTVKAESFRRGLTFVNCHYEDLFGAAQDITVLEIDPNKYRFCVLDHKTLKRTSEAASEAGAVAAINGTFYDMKKGGSVCYLQIDGVVADTTKGKDMRVRANGAVVIRNGRLSVEPWNQDKEKAYRLGESGMISSENVSVMATMPLLIKDGYAVELIEYKGFSDKRHPRSVIFERNGKICLMVIDGRSKGNAAGMTLDEVQRYLLSMDGGKGCDNAVNLDGGGSSTLWIKESGVLNHPSDNGKFDNKGERRVANSIIILNK